VQQARTQTWAKSEAEHAPAHIRAALKTLSLEPTATGEEIKRSFRQLVIRHHPDRQMQASDDERRAHETAFKQIKKAYERVLT